MLSDISATCVILFLLFVPSALLVNAGSYPRVRIFSPKENQIWFTGETRQIFWRLASLPPPPTPPTVNITLRRHSDPEYRLPITKLYPTKNLVFKWKIPKSVPNGDDYFIRINPNRPLPNRPNIMASKSKPFTIVSATRPSRTLSVLKPKAGEIWGGGQRRFIQWRFSGSVPADTTVSIFISDIKNHVVGYPIPYEIATNLPAAPGSSAVTGYRWQVPYEFRTSDGYQISIVANFADGETAPVAAVQDGTFTIQQPGAAGRATPTIIIPEVEATPVA